MGKSKMSLDVSTVKAANGDDGDGRDRNDDDTCGSAACCQTKCCQTKSAKWFRNNLLLFLLILSLAVGIGLGAALRTLDPPFDRRQLMYFRFPGDLLMRMLKCLIIPLIVTSLISGLAGLDSRASGKMGGYAIAYYMCTTLIAVLLGILLVSTIKPGIGASVSATGTAEPANIADAFLDLIRNLFPDNIVEACFVQTKTKQIKMVDEMNVTWTLNATQCNGTELECTEMGVEDHIWYDFDVVKESGMNVLGLVVFSIALGVITAQLGEVGRPIYQFTFAIAEATMKLVTAVIWYSPIGIMFLVASEIIGMEDPAAELRALGLYIATVTSGLAIHGFFILPMIYLIFVRKNPYKFMWGASQAMITALGTASSSATLPVTYRCLEHNNHVDSRVTRFVLPVGATINMDGTALYEAVAAIYIAQTRGMNLSAADIVATSITATLASIGAASVPQAGLITMIIVLTALGIPADEVTKILAVDWLLDRIRTMVNVEGDSFGAGIVAHLGRDTLSKMDAEDDGPGGRGPGASGLNDQPHDLYQPKDDRPYSYANGAFDGDDGGVGPGWGGNDAGRYIPRAYRPMQVDKSNFL